jgi:hypothetical protein
MYAALITWLKGGRLNTVLSQMGVTTPPGSTAQEVTPSGPRRRCGRASASGTQWPRTWLFLLASAAC